MNNDLQDRQAQTPQGWDKIHDIRWFAENLNGAQFRALSTGLGLGGLRPAGSRAQRAVLPSAGPVFHPPGMMQQAVSQVATTPRQVVRVPKVWWGGTKSVSSKKSSQIPQRVQSAQDVNERHVNGLDDSRTGQPNAKLTLRPTYARLLSAWAFDFLVVAVSLAVAFAVAVALTMVRTGETENWLALRPIKFLVARKPIEILAAIYAIFALYMIVFKFGAGKTIGEVVFLRKKAKTA
jgi:hypothetical protein